MANRLFAEAIERAAFTGEAVDDIDPGITDFAVLSRREKGALVLFVDALRRRGEQRRRALESLELAERRSGSS
jgi:hypothetical protein